MPEQKESTANTVSVTVVGGPTINVPYTAGMNAQEALEAAYNAVANPLLFDYAIEYFGSNLGYLVVMLNDTYESFKSSASPFFFWEFLVNDAPANQGIDFTTLNPGDAISFDLLLFSSQTSKTSTVHAKYRAKFSKI
jgi:hypothetical protein